MRLIAKRPEDFERACQYNEKRECKICPTFPKGCCEKCPEGNKDQNRCRFKCAFWEFDKGIKEFKKSTTANVNKVSSKQIVGPTSKKGKK